MNLTRALLVISSLPVAAAFAADATPSRPDTASPSPILPSPAEIVALPAAQPESSVFLDLGFGTRPVAPSRITVPLGEKLRLVVALMPDGTNYTWLRNGQAIPDAPNSHVLTLNYVTSADAGTYTCLYSTPTSPGRPSQSLILGVGAAERLLNVSTRGQVGPAPDQALTTGFVVGGGSQSKKLILRAIGPSLAAFGVTNGLRQPVLRLYDSAGRLYAVSYGYAAVAGGLTYETDLADSLRQAGAFPLPAGAGDVVELRPFEPGTYTATVTSGDGSTGTVLLEIYEVP
jgi:hypothetical protein